MIMDTCRGCISGGLHGECNWRRGNTRRRDYRRRCRRSRDPLRRYVNSQIRERREPGKISARLTSPRGSTLPTLPFTLRQYLMHVLSVIKWQRVRDHGRPPTQIIAFNSPSHPPPQAFLASLHPLPSPPRPGALLSTIRRRDDGISGRLRPVIMYFSLAPHPFRGAHSQAWNIHRLSPTLPFAKFNTRARRTALNRF